MTTAPQLALRGPEIRAGHAVWSGSFGGVEVRFVGRGPEGSRRAERAAVLSAIEPGAPPVAWARQVHSAEVLPAVAGMLGAEPARWSAWIGPAIGACCYEVGDEVALEVAAASAPEVVVPGRAERPHLDLAAAALAQLRRAGVGAVVRVAACTHCDETTLWSYRREGKGAGRNLAFIWRA